MSETFEEQEEWTEEDSSDAEGEAEGAAPAASGTRTPRDISFGTMANRNLQRARKSVMTKGDNDDDASQAQFLVQAATVYAILDLADAVRKQGK